MFKHQQICWRPAADLQSNHPKQTLQGKNLGNRQPRVHAAVSKRHDNQLTQAILTACL